MANEDEQWRDIAGYEGRYQVSDHGRVKSLAREINAGVHCRSLPEIIMRQYDQSNGYKVIYLRDGITKHKYYIHRLVAFAFLIPPLSDVVNHKNLDKQDNRVGNLEWSTFSANTQHYYDNKQKDEAF